MKEKLRPHFNRLSPVTRLQLQGAVAVTALTGFAREDARRHPARSAGYLGMIGFLLLTMPLPVPFIQILPLTCLYVMVSSRSTPWACRLHDHLSAAFNGEAVMRSHGDYVEEGHCRPDSFHLRKWPLVKDTFLTVWGDGRAVARSGWRALKGCF